MEQAKTFDDVINEFIAAAAAISKPSKLPELRSRLEKELVDCPYQVMAVYQRRRHNAQKGEYWPDKPESAPAVSRYPNILAELDASGWWIDRLACCAQVSMEIMATAMEDNGELSWSELEGLKSCFKCKLDYLISPVLSMVDPSTNKGKERLWHLKKLVRQTEGKKRYFYDKDSKNVLPALESGTPVTYAAYRWACKNLQDVLDSEDREAARQQRIRTGELLPAKAQENVQASLGARLWLARERARIRALEARLDTMRKYADSATIRNGACDFMTAQELCDLTEFSSERGVAEALILAARYGHAIGCQTSLTKTITA